MPTEIIFKSRLQSHSVTFGSFPKKKSIWLTLSFELSLYRTKETKKHEIHYFCTIRLISAHAQTQVSLFITALIWSWTITIFKANIYIYLLYANLNSTLSSLLILLEAGAKNDLGRKIYQAGVQAAVIGSVLHGDVLEEVGHGLLVVDPSDGLGKQDGYVHLSAVCRDYHTLL